MNIKLLIGLVCTAAIGTNAFALEIIKGKLISHKEWASDGAVASYLPAPKARLSMKNAGLLNKTGLEVIAETKSAATTVGQPVTISNDGWIWVNNLSEEVKQYRYTFSVCANVAENTTECAYTEDVVELQPRGGIYSGSNPALQLTYDKPGVYDMYAASFFTTSPMQSQVSMSSSSGTITVS